MIFLILPLFRPTGWDSWKKIGILEENLVQIRPTDSFPEVIPRPPPTRKQVPREPDIIAQDDQVNHGS
ncbi:unnamed protein product [Protopolystoma xenopodis]|uniref:Dynein light intermediate chain n=1 Tax=Protopolystoma xenopodis TaxID=117903 RepID=A0A3S5AUY9_9PLAT|nr:unnamed protein product [Protopolystoma xenopodis]